MFCGFPDTNVLMLINLYFFDLSIKVTFLLLCYYSFAYLWRHNFLSQSDCRSVYS